MSINLKYVKGLPELDRVLATLPAKLEAKILRGAMRAGATVVLNEARARVPVKSGRLARTLRVTTSVRRGVVTARVTAGKLKKGAKVFYAHMVEFGTGPHIIKARNAKRLRLHGNVFKKRVTHPGARKKPFLRPALDARSSAALDAVADYIRKRLDQVVK